MGLKPDKMWTKCLMTTAVAIFGLLFLTPAWGKIDLTECHKLLRQVRSGLNQDQALRVTYAMRLDTPQSSISTKAGIERINGKELLLPRGKMINSNLGLEDKKSLIYFVEVSGLPANQILLAGVEGLLLSNPGGDIAVDFYHFLIGMGYVGITQPMLHDENSISTFSHDVVNHVPGFKILSETPIWLKVTQLFAEALFVESTVDRRNSIYQSAAYIRYDLGAFLEIASARLSAVDQAGGNPEDQLKDFSKEVNYLWAKWQNEKARAQIVVPSNPLQQSPWWSRWAQRLGQLRK